MKKKLIAYGIWFATIFGIDRITKWLALHYIDHTYDVMPLLQFKLVLNRGISWGMFHSEHDGFFTLLTLFIASIVVALMFYTFRKWREGKYIFAECAVLAGAISNVLDRYLYGGVVDFIHVHIGGCSWPIFNIADAAIVLGIFWILWEQYKES